MQTSAKSQSSPDTGDSNTAQQLKGDFCNAGPTSQDSGSALFSVCSLWDTSPEEVWQ